MDCARLRKKFDCVLDMDGADRPRNGIILVG